MTIFADPRNQAADGYLRSALATDTAHRGMRDVEAWFEEQRRSLRIAVRRIPFDTLGGWSFTNDPVSLVHESGRFFSVEGLRVRTDYGPVRQWDQPILNQPEVGILGIMTRVFDGVRHFLMQAKVEPGNVDAVQLSPTVQATRSNYTRVHGGQAPRYLEYFRDRSRARVLVDELQGEQGARYFQKQNRNMIVEVDEDVQVGERFCWMTLAQIKQLLKRANVVNMDTRTVLACLPVLGRGPQAPDSDAAPSPPLLIGDLPLGGFARELLASVIDTEHSEHTLRELMHWLTELRARHEMRLERRSLTALDGWTVGDMAIEHPAARHFSVIAVDVESGVREVSRWQQPLIAHSGLGLNSFLLQRRNGVMHFLVRACMYPGNRQLFELGSTVSRSNADVYVGRPGAPPFLDLVFHAPASWIRYDAIQSEEGGRFYQYQNRYTIVEAPEGEPIEATECHRWMTLGQIQELLHHGYFNVEARNLIACLDLCHGADS
jgi:oxidase EvaA